MLDTSGEILHHVRFLALIVNVWLLHLVPLLLVCGPVWFFGRNRVKWSVWDFSIVIVPFACWATLMVVHDVGKTLANLVIEGVVVGCIASLAPVARILARTRWNQTRLAVILLILACLAATGLWALVPALPER
jgi:hypothetical protein